MYELVYTSTLAPTTLVTELAGIVRHARIKNTEAGVQGLLIFDGDRFCQYLGGLEDAVRGLARRIQADKRHVDFTLRHAGLSSAPPLARRPLSYGLALDVTDMDTIMAAIGADSVAALAAILPRLDLDP